MICCDIYIPVLFDSIYQIATLLVQSTILPNEYGCILFFIGLAMLILSTFFPENHDSLKTKIIEA